MQHPSYWDKSFDQELQVAEVTVLRSSISQPTYILVQNKSLLKQVKTIQFGSTKACQHVIIAGSKNAKQPQESWKKDPTAPSPNNGIDSNDSPSAINITKEQIELMVDEELGKLPPALNPLVKSFWQTNVRQHLANSGVPKGVAANAIIGAAAEGGWFAKFRAFCKKGLCSVSPQQLLSQGLKSAAFGFVVGFIDELLVPFQKFKLVHNILRGALMAASGILTVVFLATSLMSGAPIAAIILNLLVSVVGGIIGGCVGQIVAKGFLLLWRTFLPDLVQFDQANQGPNIHLRAIHIEVQVPANNNQNPNALLAALNIAPEPHTCQPLMPGYFHAPCVECGVRPSSVGFIHGHLLHICVCSQCATNPQFVTDRCADCNAPATPFIYGDAQGNPVLCAANHCVLIGSCRICGDHSTRLNIRETGEILTFCEVHNDQPDAPTIVPE